MTTGQVSGSLGVSCLVPGLHTWRQHDCILHQERTHFHKFTLYLNPFYDRPSVIFVSLFQICNQLCRSSLMWEVSQLKWLLEVLCPLNKYVIEKLSSHLATVFKYKISMPMKAIQWSDFFTWKNSVHGRITINITSILPESLTNYCNVKHLPIIEWG